MSARNRLALTLVCFLLGASLVAQMRGRRGQALSTVPSADLSTILGGLVVTNGQLRDEVSKLEGELRTYNRAAERAVLPQMVEELNNMRMVNGHVEVTGPGVEVSIGGGISAVDLQDTVNEIRNVGAEAISLNGTRLTITSAITQDSRGVMLDGLRIEPPFIFDIIGDPATMETALNRPGGQLSFLQATYQGLTVEVKTMPMILLPAKQKGPTFMLAQPVEPAQ